MNRDAQFEITLLAHLEDIREISRNMFYNPDADPECIKRMAYRTNDNGCHFLTSIVFKTVTNEQK